ncbi:DUF1176 domain-containing protein [Shimwellia pseudoproteus]|uniref:DUF1176 domain-containing protein n=1 Tax=Shimwellia pseudoproteus TaxID=570012 RepID=UPI0018EB26AA|nr:DUF1176 domain-containing protein [Shimwellia pseudoproteus]MBJ3815123.1 DUF1176 domain-containing protein [Shimwellia pseudoproteus]
MGHRILNIVIVWLLSTGAAMADPVQQSFGDWQVTCNNQNFCQARNTGAYSGLVMTLGRSPGAKNDLSLRLDLGSIDRPISSPDVLTTDLRLDGAPLVLSGKWQATPHHLYTDDTGAVNRLLSQLQPASSLSLSGGKQTISLSGLMGALNFIDQQQRRAGSETAWVQKGDNSPLNVPPAPALSTVTAPKNAVAPLSQQEFAGLRDYGDWRMAYSNCSLDPGRRQLHLAALSGDKALIMIDCEAGAYNVVELAWLVSRTPPYAARPLRLLLPFSPANQPREVVLMNARYDEARNELATLAKWRGVGDCGVATRWRFDGQRFQLVRYAQESQCDGWHGADSWPTLWVTQ